METIKFRSVLTWSGQHWQSQILEYDWLTRSPTLRILRIEIVRALRSCLERQAIEHARIDPFRDGHKSQAAPHYHDKWRFAEDNELATPIVIVFRDAPALDTEHEQLLRPVLDLHPDVEVRMRIAS